MIIGTVVLAVLILLLLVAERASSMLWQSGKSSPFFYCARCDLRYPRDELADLAATACPRGHAVQPVPKDFPWTNVFIAGCVSFIAASLLLIATGNMPTR